MKRIALVGNPNVGKSVIFGLLTGRYVTVSNYPGTTVEVLRGRAYFDRTLEIVDTPGVLCLIPHSEDERVARDILLLERPDLVVQIADAKNLTRSFCITIQLAELGLPTILALNMYDEVLERGMDIDVEAIRELVGIEAIPMVAIEREGISQLIDKLAHARVPQLRIDYGERLEEAITRICELLPDISLNKRGCAVMVLAGDTSILQIAVEHFGMREEDAQQVLDIVQELQRSFPKPLSFTIASRRWAAASELARKVLTQPTIRYIPIREKLGLLMMRPLFGAFVASLVLYLLYKVVGQFGAGTCVDFLESKIFGSPDAPSGGFDLWLRAPFTQHVYTFAHIPFDGINWYLARAFQKLRMAKPVYDFLLGQYGLISMGLTYAFAIVMPIVAFFFIFFGILEDSGYLPRLAVLVNRIFKKIGLTGRAVLPMILGLGCVTMATLTTRILETKRERFIATLLLALGIPCSAQLGVTLGLVGSISGKALFVVFGTVLLQLFLVGYLASKVMPGEVSDFLTEIPPLRIPKLRNLLVKTWMRVKWYLREAVPLFLLGTVLLFFLDKMGALAKVEKAASPILRGFLQLPEETAHAFILGFLRRDYGAAGLYMMAQRGLLDHIQIVVSMVVIILFIPCIASLFVIIKEQGWLKTAAIIGFVLPFSIFVGGVLNFILRIFGVQF